MQIQRALTSMALITALAFSGGSALAESEEAMMDDTIIEAEEAVEAVDQAAADEAAAAVARDKEMDAEAAELQSEMVSGDMDPAE